MRFLFALLLLGGLVAGGCASRNAPPTFSEPPDSGSPAAKIAPGNPPALVASPAASRKKPESEGKLIVTPENTLTGNVMLYNSAGRFVVLDFPVGKMPGREQVLSVYRQGLKVGEVRVTGPERDLNTVADVISGEAQKGDEVRDR